MNPDGHIFRPKVHTPHRCEECGMAPWAGVHTAQSSSYVAVAHPHPSFTFNLPSTEKPVPNHVNINELEPIHHLVAYLNKSKLLAAKVDAEITLTDANGDCLGTIKLDMDQPEPYIWEFPA
jgi:hypothetical protein